MTTNPTVQIITPYISVHDGAAALDWYTNAFGAVETVRYVGDDGRLGHAEFLFNGARIMMSDAYPEMGVVAANSQEGSSCSLHVEVADCDAGDRCCREDAQPRHPTNLVDRREQHQNGCDERRELHNSGLGLGAWSEPPGGKPELHARVPDRCQGQDDGDPGRGRGGAPPDRQVAVSRRMWVLDHGRGRV